MKRNTAMFIVIFLVPVAFAALLGGIYAGVRAVSGGSFLNDLWQGMKVMYFVFCAGIHVGGILRLVFKIDEVCALGFGAALYYGTILLAAFLSDYITGAAVNRYIISFIIVSLICYIVWLKKLKPEE